LCKEDADVTCLVRRSSNLRWIAHLPVHLIYGDVTKPESLPSAVRGKDFIFHTAGLVKARRRRDFYRVNTTGTKNLIKATLKYNKTLDRFVYLSSQAAAGPAPHPFPITEESRCRPITAYGKSKRKGERWFSKTPRWFPWTIIRPPAVYGPRDSEILEFVKSAAKGWFPMIGTPHPTISLVYARDLCNAVILAARCPAALHQTYFVNDGVYYHWEVLVDALEQNLNRPLRRVWIPTPVLHTVGFFSEVSGWFRRKTPMLTREKAMEIAQPFWMCSSEKIQKDCGFKPAISLLDGLRETIAWYKRHHWI
jgi:nucleoside-diphosphate-sugar epimerase